MDMTNSCVIPTIPNHGNDEWKMLHNRYVAESKVHSPEIILIGASIIQLIQCYPIWNEKFVPLNCLNFGISGDRTQDVLWRVKNDLLDHINPKVCILNVGSNNVDNTPVEISEGILAIVNEIQSKLPNCNIIVIGILPRGPYPNPLRSLGTQVNRILSQKIKNMFNVKLFTADFLLQSNETLSQEDVPDYLHPSEKVRNIMDLVHLNFFTSVPLKWRLGVQLSELVMSHRNMKKFMRSDSYSFDLVMIETFCQEYTVAVGHKFNAPVVNLAPAMVWASIGKWLHVPSTFSYVPDSFVKTASEMSFVERVKNTVTGVMQLYVENYFYLPKIKEIMNKHFVYRGWESRPPLEHMLNNVSLTLTNSHYALGIPRPYLPGVIEVGGMHIKEPKSLPEGIQTFIDSAEHGLIYFSFGTYVNLNDVPKEKLNIFLKVIGKLKQKVILKWTTDNSVMLSENIMTGSWFPQNDILAHPNVRLFITHGGFHSLEETVFNAKPIIGIPFFADQYSNMKLVEEKGYGKLVDFFEMTEESFANAIEEVLSNPSFQEKAMIQSSVYRDQPMKPLDRAVYWVEYVIQNGGDKHLKSVSIGLNDLQYFLFDVSLVLIVTTGLIVWLCFCIVKFIIKTGTIISAGSRILFTRCKI